MLNLSSEVQSTLTAAGISQEECQEMLKGAALITHTLGNRRFHGWVFRVKGDLCISMNKWVREIIRSGPEDMVIYEDCSHCDGEGCSHCDGIGEVCVIYKRQRSVKNEKSLRYW